MKRTKTSLRWTDDIETLLERLGFLQITNGASDEVMSEALVPAMMNNT